MVKKVTQPMLPGMPRNRDLLTDETRYKRGYTPERKREITDAFKNTEFDVMHNSEVTTILKGVSFPHKGQISVPIYL